MTFATTALAIAGLAAMAIPILIHLLWRQRRKPVRWAAMRFLLEAWQRQRRRLRLEQWLLLVMRCLIVALVGAALARPVLHAAGILELTGARQVYLVLDDGIASGAIADDGRPVLARHVERAVDVIESLRPGDVVGLVTAAAPARGVVVPPSGDHRAVIDLLEGLEPSEAATDLDGALRLVADAIAEDAQPVVYLLSDFRAGNAPLDRPLADALAAVPPSALLLATQPAEDAIPDVQIVAVDPARSVLLPDATDGSGQVTVRLRRVGGDLDATVGRVRLQGPDLPRTPPATVQWARGAPTTDVDFRLDDPPAVRELRIVAALDDDRLGADDRRQVVLSSREHLRVLLVDRRTFGFESTLDRLSAGQWIRRALEPAPEGPVQIVEVEPAALDAADLAGQDVAMVPRPDLLGDDGWRALRGFVDRGGVLWIMPPAEANVHQWVERLGPEFDLPWRLGLEVVDDADGAAIADDVDPGPLLRMITGELPTLVRPVRVFRRLAFDEDTVRGERALRLTDGSTLMTAATPQPADGPPARGLVVLLATAPDLRWTNLPTKPLLVPLLHESIRQSLGIVRGGGDVLVGAAGRLPLPPAARAVVDPDGARIVLDDAGRPARPLGRSGLWSALDAGGQPVATLAVNVDPEAARTDLQSPAAVEAWLGTSGPWRLMTPETLPDAVGAAETGSPLAAILLLVAIVLVVLETILARWFSHARITAAKPESGAAVFGGAVR